MPIQAIRPCPFSKASCALAGSGSGGKGRMPKSSVGTLTFAVDTSAQPVSGAASMKA